MFARRWGGTKNLRKPRTKHETSTQRIRQFARLFFEFFVFVCVRMCMCVCLHRLAHLALIPHGHGHIAFQVGSRLHDKPIASHEYCQARASVRIQRKHPLTSVSRNQTKHQPRAVIGCDNTRAIQNIPCELCSRV